MHMHTHTHVIYVFLCDRVWTVVSREVELYVYIQHV